MIGRLQGTVVDEAPDGSVVIDVHGVGYEVLVPLGTLGRCPRDGDNKVTLAVVTHVREDAITLFGFADDRERLAFRMLTAVAGVGPRTAVAVLGSLPASDLMTAVARGDVKRLQAVPGVGKRIAERLVLELKDKLTGLPAGAASSATVTASGASTPTAYASAGPVGAAAQLVATLERLGFKTVEAERAASELSHRASEPLDALVRDALKLLVK